MSSFTSYKNKYSDFTEGQLLELGYETGKDLLELNILQARLDDDKRKKMHRVLQLLKIDYTGLSDAQKCYVVYRRYKEYLQNKKSNE